jgi:hypothetical protein
VCGGSALIGTGLFPRSTKDVDVVALRNNDGDLITSRPLPDELKAIVLGIARDLGLMDNWLNSGPADLFEMGMPENFEERLTTETYGSHLVVSYVGRKDQIYFKLYASVDRGGYHLEDLRELKPTTDELEAAAKWSMTHDVSEGYKMVLVDMLRKMGYANVADKL